jgi:heme/copper-type cytochrome/quinol oxidase subunit 2
MEGMTVQDVMALNEITRRDHHQGKWSMATSLWVIVGIIFVVALLWFIHRNGKDKADLAASVQGLAGRLNAIEPAVTAQGNNIFSINSVLSATTQAIGDFKTVTNQQLAALDGAVFVARCSGGCNNGGARFVKRDNYSLCDSSLQAIETCGNS